MKNRRTAFLALEVLLAFATLTFAFSGRALDSSTDGDSAPEPGTTAPPPGWLERDTLTGDWGLRLPVSCSNSAFVPVAITSASAGVYHWVRLAATPSRCVMIGTSLWRFTPGTGNW